MVESSTSSSGPSEKQNPSPIQKRPTVFDPDEEFPWAEDIGAGKKEEKEEVYRAMEWHLKNKQANPELTLLTQRLDKIT